ncbi:hypothetical protein QRD02_12460 [Aequorivita sp. SDUM287046]|uniref:Uncharacterized protein n=1 Tax=Aequorivita aurantiaca TaxID=3053356 RepID=A0ABT8DME9_9FLAO|nr:hypothetical protein [Aequorivita aurantiaca]MDN3725194.1 hypothetical protein [Aequorivita aurantiaca]
MQTHKNNFATDKNKRLLGILSAVIILLLIPLIAMQFTDEVNWDLFDFIVMGVLLLGTGLSCEFVLRMIKKPIHRIIICAIILMVLFLIWAELAVGIFGSPVAGT